jgi:hypothetical protein
VVVEHLLRRPRANLLRVPALSHALSSSGLFGLDPV